MTGFAERLKEERRLVLLRCLSDAPGYSANESVLRTALEHYGFSVGRDTIRRRGRNRGSAQAWAWAWGWH